MEVTLSLWPALITIFTLLLTISILCRTKLSSSSSTTEWPIGPKTLPIIGNLHQLGAEVQHVALSKLAKLHGGVMTIWIGSWRPVIVVSNIAEAWEVLVNKSLDYAARGPPEVTKLSTAGWRTVSTSDPGLYWHNLRKGLQNGPLSPINVSAQMHFQERDIEHMINDMQEEAKINGGIVKPLDHLKRAAVRLLSRLIFGQTFDDKLFIESMHHQIDELIRMSGYFHLSEAFSYAKYLPSHRRAVKQLRQINLAIKELIQPFLASSPPSNSYLNFLLSQDYPHDVVVACITELYVLGVDSTSATTTWALAFLIHDQTAQENLYKNIKQNTVNGDSTILKTEDFSKMHYLQAVMKETMRMKPIAPFAIPHKSSKDTTLMGRKVAKGTRVMVSIYALHHNPNAWTEPYKFMPERFLQGDRKVMDPSFLPFSAGMRTCAGMELGKLQFSLALANLVNFFKWTNAVEGELPDMSEELSLVTLMKTPLEARIIPRKT